MWMKLAVAVAVAMSMAVDVDGGMKQWTTKRIMDLSVNAKIETFYIVFFVQSSEGLEHNNESKYLPLKWLTREFRRTLLKFILWTNSNWKCSTQSGDSCYIYVNLIWFCCVAFRYIDWPQAELNKFVIQFETSRNVNEKKRRKPEYTRRQPDRLWNESKWHRFRFYFLLWIGFQRMNETIFSRPQAHNTTKSKKLVRCEWQKSGWSQLRAIFTKETKRYTTSWSSMTSCV